MARVERRVSGTAIVVTIKSNQALKRLVSFSYGLNKMLYLLRKNVCLRGQLRNRCDYTRDAKRTIGRP